jgi:small subunit ribosomal protein S21|tara:strand:+ start:2140 stop:2328 length:189 start_codon:yes stop_codon:yes gene_type:complete
MLIVEVKKDNIEKALKIMKRKVRSTKQYQTLRDSRFFNKKSQVKRLQKQKAVYIQKLKDEEE